MCKSICDGIETSRNECLELTFQENGKGSLKKPGEESDFDWKLKDEYIEFNFHNKSDKKLFFSNDTIFIFETYKFEKVQIKLTSENSKCYYLLIENN